MAIERYPVDLVVTESDFASCGWQAVVSGAQRDGYPSFWQAFSNAARQAIEEGRLSHGKVLWLLADACSMSLVPKSNNEPYKPYFIMEGQRSVIPDDFSDTDIGLFAQIVDEIDDVWMKARLADLVWLVQRPRNVRYALVAIDAYRAIPLERDTWVAGVQQCWERAIGLTRMLRDGAGDRYSDLETSIIAAFEHATHGDGYFSLWLADLLETNHMARLQRASVAQKLELLAREFDTEGDLHRSRDFFRASARWFSLAGDDVKAAEMTASLAEGWVKEAIARTSSAQPSFMVAASFYENAIQIYRTIPRSERAAHRADERMVELRISLTEAGERSLGEMKTISAPAMDISQLVEKAQSAVRGKSVPEALDAFANLHGGARAKELRENAIELLRDHPISAMMPATVVSRDGRVIAKRPGMSFGSDLSESDEIVIEAEMLRHYGILVSLVVQGDILPALEVLVREHRLREAGFVELAWQSPIVPPGRERLFGKALFAGFDGDFVTALHLLVPQIEHMIRTQLKNVGMKTTNLDINGIENENGLSTLMDLPDVGQVFGEDLAFELRSLFCNPFGPNLRNELAHGLLSDHDCQTAYAIYAWWLALKLVFNMTKMAARSRVEAGAGDADPDPAPDAH